MSNATQTPAAEARCLRPGCGRKLTSEASIKAGYGPTCLRKIRAAAKTADLSAWTPVQVEAAIELIADGGVVPSTREDVFHTVSTDGTEIHRTHPHGCNCTNGLQTRPPRPCLHRCAVTIVLASQAPVSPAPAARVAIPAPAPAGDIFAELDRITSLYMATA